MPTERGEERAGDVQVTVPFIKREELEGILDWPQKPFNIFAYSVAMLATRTASRLCKLTRALKVPLSRNSHALASNRFLKVSEEVRDAVATGRPVVALESTIYTHGNSDLDMF